MFTRRIIRVQDSFREVSGLPSKTRVNEFHLIAFGNASGHVISTIHEAAVDFYYHRRVVLLSVVKKLHDCQAGSCRLFGKAVEYKFQILLPVKAVNGISYQSASKTV